MNDKLKRMEELLAEMQRCSDAMIALADEIRATPEGNIDTGVDMLSAYIHAINGSSTRYWVNSDGEVSAGVIDYRPDDYNPYCNYNNDTYAKTAARMKKFTDMLLAFKWCYDRAYEPNWSANDDKYFIAYDFVDGHYCTTYSVAMSYNVVYFSSEGIALKCVDWLNRVDPKGTLLLGTESNEEEVSI